MSRIVIASAAGFESDPLVARLENAGVTFTRIITGVGLTQASMTCTRLSHIISQRDVFFVCTGGILEASFELEVYQARKVCLLPYDVRGGFSELPGEFEPNLELKGIETGFQKRDVAGSLGVSVVSERGANYSGFIETMELYGVARAWHHSARSITAVVAATNATGPGGRGAWRDNFRVAAQLTAEKLAPKIISHFHSRIKNHEAH